MAAKQRRIFQVAKECNVSNEALLEFLTKHNYSVKNHMNPVTEEMYDIISKKFLSSGPITTVSNADYEFRKRLKEKKAVELKRKEQAQEELAHRIEVARGVKPKKVKRRAPSKEEVLKIAVDSAKAEALELIKEGSHKEKKAKDVQEPPVVETPKDLKTTKPESPVINKESITEEQPVQLESTVQDEGVVKETTEHKTPVEETKTVTKEKSKKKETDQRKDDTAKVAGERSSDKKRSKSKDLEKQDSQQSLDDDADGKKGKKKRKKKKRKISDEEIEASIKQTFASMGEGKGRRKHRKVKSADDEFEEDTDVPTIKVSEFISAADLAKLMEIEASSIIRKCLELGMMISINQRLDMDTITMLADEFGYEVEQEKEFASLQDEEEEDVDDDKDLKQRPPVVTIMGHVDHGKTSLLDYIRKSNVIAGEAGGITQHIGAYEVTVKDDKHITFLDTPGHEAFTAMRARGAQATDIVILIVAADDGVQEQTLEALNHAKAAEVPIIIAINKVDKPNANPDQIKQQLSSKNILVESWGGKYQDAEISAKTGDGIEKLLESILLESEMLELKANPSRDARGLVVEAELDKGKGPIATVLVQNGTLHVGDIFVSGLTYGRVRALLDERGKRVKEAPPSTPIRVIGFSSVPQSGDRFSVLTSEKEAREISMKRQQLRREQEIRQVKHLTLDQISRQIKEGSVRELNIIVKADVDGSVEAIADSLMKLSTNEVAVNVIHKAVGGISETDVNLAVASQAVIIGFHVRVALAARELAEREEIDIRLYQVIYDAVNDVKSALEGMLQPELKEETSGTIEVRETFKVPKIGTIAGCYVTSGKIHRNDPVRLYRENKLIYEGKIGSLKRFKDDVKEVLTGFECGLGIEGYDDIHVNDIIETYKIIEIKRTLS
ncbi:MAG: translation initiation factor IF-2 [Deferribacteres bacterium]|nr:translation initiation factor IF-2 [candidate division KSB1 bacterium]MCB9501337.1 translation initiation factor IF-2 [Deferribacteres bacterium]